MPEMGFLKFLISRKWSSNNLDQYGFWTIFCLVSLVCWGIIFISEKIIFTDEFYTAYYGQISTTMLESVFDFQKRFWWIGYFLKSFFVLIKVGLSCVCILTGAILTDTEFSIHSLFKVTLIAYGIFILSDMWFLHKLYLNLEILTFETSEDHYP